MIPSNDLLRPDNQEVVTLTLPWPNRSLSPNARVHWASKAAVVKSARYLSYVFTRKVVGPVKPCWPAAKIDMVFCPPDNRRRDTDNMIAATKAHRDGISDALGVDDSRFVSTYSMGEPVKGGAVHVTIARAG